MHSFAAFLALLACASAAKQSSKQNLCSPSPCGGNSECVVVRNEPVCKCSANYVGKPPNCKPECGLDADCSLGSTCIENKCVDPCSIATCGSNAECRVKDHAPECVCHSGFTGDPTVKCSPATYPANAEAPPTLTSPCSSPCGVNASCVNGSCECDQGHAGDPLASCARSECTRSCECPKNRVCARNACVDPCAKACGANARCQYQSQSVTCSCLRGYAGNPLEGCAKEANCRPGKHPRDGQLWPGKTRIRPVFTTPPGRSRPSFMRH